MVAIEDSANAPAAAGGSIRAAYLRALPASGASATAASTATVASSGPAPVWPPLRAGVTMATAPMPRAMAHAAKTSRLPTGSPRTGAASASTTTTVNASAGCTSVTGASQSAAACSAHPRPPRPSPRFRRGLQPRRSSIVGARGHGHCRCPHPRAPPRHGTTMSRGGMVGAATASLRMSGMTGAPGCEATQPRGLAGASRR